MASLREGMVGRFLKRSLLNNAIQYRVGKGVKKPELEETSFMDDP